jgi:long-chain acyl-CoA synthetase
MSYAQLIDQVERAAAVLAELGVRKGDRVALALPNCPQFVIGYYGAARIGAVAVGIDPRFTTRELTAILSDSGACVLVAMPPMLALLSDARLPELKAQVAVSFGQAPVPSTTPSAGAGPSERHEWNALMSAERAPAPPEPIDPESDLAALLYTGGTTGSPKGVMLTHHNLVRNAAQGASWFTGVEAGKERILCLLPFFHAYGMTVGMNVGIRIGAELVLVMGFDPAATVKIIEEKRPTMMPGVPLIFGALCQVAEGRDLTSIRACLSGADALQTPVRERFETITGGRISEGFGQTETSPSTHANPLFGVRKAGSFGLPLPDTDCRIVDLENPELELPPGQKGQLLISGPQVMRGYWNRPEESRSVLKAGWLATGDVAWMDEDGFFFFVDRIRDTIKVKGYGVFPSEVEQVLMSHPGIKGACVVGTPDERDGHALIAFVVPGQPGLTEWEILEWCQDRSTGLAPYKQPRRIVFRDSIPMTPMGKPLRRELRDEALGRNA